MKKIITLFLVLTGFVCSASADNFRIVGGFTSWNYSDASEWEMTQNPTNNNLWTLYKSWTANSNSVEFKAYNNSGDDSDWMPNYNVTASFENGKTYDLFFILNTDDSTLKLITSVNIKGDFNSWGDGSGTLSMNSSGITYTEAIDLSETTNAQNFKICIDYNGVDDCYLGYNDNVNLTALDGLISTSGSNDHNFRLDNIVKAYKNFLFTATWSPNNGHSSTGSAWTLSITPSNMRNGVSKILFDNTDQWSHVFAYNYTDNENHNTGWPGEELTKIDGYYTYFYTTPYDNIIFNDKINNKINESNTGNQTGDLDFIADRIYDTNGPISESVSVNTYGNSTFSSQYPLDFSTASPSGLKAYKITASNKATGELTKEEVTKVPANTGLYIEGTSSTDYTVYATATASDIDANMLVAGTGTKIDPTDGTNTNFILTVNKADGTTVDTPKFFKVNSAGNTVPAGKAYLQIPTASAARDYFWFNEETAVNVVKQEQAMDGQAYNLAGQRVAQPKKGLYIVNGKKVIIK